MLVTSSIAFFTISQGSFIQNVEPFPSSLSTPISPHFFDKPARNNEAQSGSTILASRRGIGLAESMKQRFLLDSGQTDSCIGHISLMTALALSSSSIMARTIISPLWVNFTALLTRLEIICFIPERVSKKIVRNVIINYGHQLKPLWCADRASMARTSSRVSLSFNGIRSS